MLRRVIEYLRRAPGAFRALRHDRVAVALALLLLVGLALRVWMTLVWRPALVGYSDSGIYFQGMFRSVWADPIRTVGYSMFLRGLHAVSPHLILVTVVQHILGLIAAVVYFLAVGRCRGPRGLGLAPAAVIALTGDEIFIEHAALSDFLFMFLLSLMLYFAMRASQGGLRWAVLAGLCAGLGVWDRDAGIAMIAVIALWLVFCAGRPTRRTLALGLVALAVATGTVGVYVEWRQQATGLSGLTSNSAWNLYERVAPWADCTKFTPPPGTQGLCESTPPSQRPIIDYIYGLASPGYKLFGPAYRISSYPHAMALLKEWSEAAILGEPLEYLHQVWRDAVRFVYSGDQTYGGLTPEELMGFLLYGINGTHANSGTNEFVNEAEAEAYPGDPPAYHGAIGPLRSWEKVARLEGVVMVVLLMLCLAGPWLLSGRARAGMILFGVTGLVLLFFPIMVKGYDYRFVIPAYAPLVAAATVSAWGLVVKVRPRLSAHRRREIASAR